MSEEIYIVSGARTPMGGLMGDLAAVTAPQLGSTAIKAAVERSVWVATRLTRSSWAVCSQRALSNVPHDRQVGTRVCQITWAQSL